LVVKRGEYKISGGEGWVRGIGDAVGRMMMWDTMECKTCERVDNGG
jgi:hypothetical protein